MSTVGFEQARSEFAARTYQYELERKARLDTKANLVLTYVTVILGATVLNVDALSSVIGVVRDPSVPGWVVYVFLGSALLLAVAILLVTVETLLSLALRKIAAVPDESPTTYLFRSPHPDFDPTLSSFHIQVAKIYAFATESSRIVNREKARHLAIAMYGTYATVALLFILAVISALAALATS